MRQNGSYRKGTTSPGDGDTLAKMLPWNGKKN